MSKSLDDIDSPYLKYNEGRIRQGDILRDLNFIFEWKPEEGSSDKYIIKSYEFLYTVVLSQDCDLEQDSANRHDTDNENQDGYIPSILVCPAYLADDFKNGIQLETYGLRMEKNTGKKWDYIKTNRNPRYHYLLPDANLQTQELVLDFKHFYTLPNNFLNTLYQEQYNRYYLASLNILFRECLCQRFSYYISRVGLPAMKKVSKS